MSRIEAIVGASVGGLASGLAIAALVLACWGLKTLACWVANELDPFE